MDNQTQALNKFLEAKGVSTNLKVKRSLAQAFGLPMDNGTDEQQGALLLALKVGLMANNGDMQESFKVTVAFKNDYWTKFDKLEDAEKEMQAIVDKGFAGAITRETTISHLEKTVYPKQ